jgi:nitroimidazol reductase NimA-like FMN-containing flavoprotein (pyridoxamine 5'-phosphate oxidase superfamily)
MSNPQTLTEQECLSLLARFTLGRLGVVAEGYPVIFPVNYALDGKLITFRTSPGTKFDAARYGHVSFQVDQMEFPGRSAWSVLVLGTATVPDTDDPAVVQRLQQLGITPLDPGDKPLWVQVVPHRITGRRITAEDVGYAPDPRGYL